MAGSELAVVLTEALATAGINQAELARRAGLTRAYVGRLLGGSQGAPTAGVLHDLGVALGLDQVDRLRLYAAAGLLPEAEAGLLRNHPSLTRLLTTFGTLDPVRQAQVTRLLDALLDLTDTGAVAGRANLA